MKIETIKIKSPEPRNGVLVAMRARKQNAGAHKGTKARANKRACRGDWRQSWKGDE